MTKKIEIMVQEAEALGYERGVRDTGCVLTADLILAPPYRCYFDANLLVKDCKHPGVNSLPWPPCTGCMAPKQFQFGFDKGWTKCEYAQQDAKRVVMPHARAIPSERQMDGRP
jgi:hypothetical protein